MLRPTPAFLFILVAASCLVPSSLPAQEKAKETPDSKSAPKSTSQDKKASKATQEKEKEEDAVPPDHLDAIAKMQFLANAQTKADWGHWGNRPSGYHAWTNHSNRLIPVYVFGDSLDAYQDDNSLYRSEERIRELYGRLPVNTVNPKATYADQTDIYRLQRRAIESGKKKYVFLIVFDGMDWQTTWAASIYKQGKVNYTEGRGTGLAFQDYRGTDTDFGYFVSSAYSDDCEVDADAQQILVPWKLRGGYDARLGGDFPWSKPTDPEYPIGRSKVSPHCYTDSSSSATSLTAGIKTFNGAVNVTYDCRPVPTIAHWAQREKQMAVGAVTSVPISHATPAAAYSHNVSRDDFQDISRDLLGMPSISHKRDPLPGLDVIIGTGWGVETDDNAGQGKNYIPKLRYLAEEDKERCNINNGGKYVVAERTAGMSGKEVLLNAAQKASTDHQRLLGFFGTKNGHLPFRTANGDFVPTRDVKGTESYTPEDLQENPQLEDMTEAAIQVLSQNPNGFWLMIEAGDVDWANHANNIDNSIGAVFSGDAAFQKVVRWIESKNAWNDSLVILTADHGHYLNLVKPEAIAEASLNTTDKK